MVGLRSDLPDGNDTIAHRMCRPRLEQDQSGAAQRRVRIAGLPAPLPRRMLDQRHRAAPGETHMRDSKPTPRSPLRIIIWSLIAAFVLFYGGYHLGKDMALRDNARQAAGK
ncbi:TPA: hypothetical protein UMB92_000552 [Stenotrophomonas maltophilia]|nr:hypothetical protein [Stenotrophomonas maltophilia]